MKAIYSINIERDSVKFLSCVDDAIWSNSPEDYASFIVNVLCQVSKNNIKAMEFIDRIKDDFDPRDYYKLRSQIRQFDRQYDLALSDLDQAFSRGFSFDNYCVAKSFCLLDAGRFDQVVLFIDMNICSIKNAESKDVLFINKASALKLSDKKYSEIEVRNVVSHAYSDDLIICAESILGHTVKAKRKISEVLDVNYIKIYDYMSWPAVSSECYSEFMNTNINNVVCGELVNQ